MGAMIYERLYKNRNGQLFAGNREVVPGETYTLATLDMFTFGFFFPSLKEAEKEYLYAGINQGCFWLVWKNPMANEWSL